MSTSQLDNVAEGKIGMKPNMAGTDGGWIHAKPLQHRYVTSTNMVSFDGESAWRTWDPHVLVPKEWGKQGDNWKFSLRDWPEPTWSLGGDKSQKATWKHANVKRWPLHRVPKHDRPGIESNL